MKNDRDYWKTLSDAALVKLFQEGEYEAMDALTERYTLILLPFLTKKTGNEYDAGDVLQETLMIVLLRLNHGAYTEQGVFDKWIKTIAFRQAVNFLIRNNEYSKMK